MTFGNRTTAWIASGLLLSAAACSSGSSSGSSNIDLESVVQDLTADPDGLTTVIEFARDPGSINTGHVRANGTPSAVTVTGSGKTRTVLWDQRVTPSHRVKISGKAGVEEDWERVSTTDASAPTFAMGVGVQDTGDLLLGGDQLTVTFTGPRVVEAAAENVSSWMLMVNGTTVDLTGSTFTLDVATQVLTMDFGPNANLHSTFSLASTGLTSVADVALSATPVAGTAAGDVAAPTATSIEQMLAQDEYGRVIDFVFNEPMDPYASTGIGNFGVNDGPGAVGLTLATNVTQVDALTLRVTFNNPVVPGFDTITHTGLMDAHGNAYAAGTVAVGNANAALNAYDTVTATTAANAGNDSITIVTDQAFDPDFAVLPTSWTIDVDAVTLTMADQTLSYDLLTKTLTIDLDFDMRNGDVVDVTGLNVEEVDGEFFTDNTIVAAGGDVDPPAVVSVTQNRTSDPTGTTVDVAFDEDIDPATATNAANYTFTPAAVINTLTLLAGGDTVRIDTSSVLTPGDVTLTVLAAVEDLAGMPMGADQGPIAIVSTDSTPPTPLTVMGNAIEGADDDTIVVAFDDELVEAEIETPGNWNLESPVGTPFTIVAPTISWNRASRTATLTLDEGGQALLSGDDVGVSFTGIRDIGGNAIDTNPITGPIDAETSLPAAHTAWRHDAPADGTIVIRFTEPCGSLTDLYPANPQGTRYAIRMNDVGQTLRGYPAMATVLDGGLGVELQYGFTIALTDTLDVIGVTDLTGNIMFPAMDMPIVAEDANAPDHNAAPTVTAVSGENNDTILLDFSVPMSPWYITNPDSYAIVTNPGAVPVDLSAATIEWLTSTSVQITLDGESADSLDAAALYDVTLELDGSNPLQSAQGIALTAAGTMNVPVGGDDTNGPTLAGSRLVFSSALDDEVAYFVFDEAVDEVAVEASIANWVYDGVSLPTGGLELISPRVVRLDFATTLTPGFNVEVMQPATVDLAGNDAGGSLTLALQDDATAPLLASVDGQIRVGAGGDTIAISFNEQVDLVTGLDTSNYTVTNGTVVDLSGAAMTYDSVTTSVTITLPVGVELDATSGISAQVMGVTDVAGNAITTATLGGLLTGDAAAPSITSAWTNYQADNSGRTVDVQFSEDVDESFLTIAAGNWSTSGAALPTSVEFISGSHVRVTLNAALAPSDTLDLVAGLEDLARNAAGALSEDPIDPID